MIYNEITLNDITELTKMYVDTFNVSPWNDEWTLETAAKRLHQMICCEGFYGLAAYRNEVLCGMILGSEEQFYNGIMFNIKEFCVRNDMRNKGIGTKILMEFEERLRNKGVTEVILFTSKSNGTEEFYEKRGLKPYDGMVMMGKQL